MPVRLVFEASGSRATAAAIGEMRGSMAGLTEATAAAAKAQTELGVTQTRTAETTKKAAVSATEAARAVVAAEVEKREALRANLTEYAALANAAVKGSEEQVAANRLAAESAAKLGVAYREAGVAAVTAARRSAEASRVSVRESQLARGFATRAGGTTALGGTTFLVGAVAGFAVHDAVKQANSFRDAMVLLETQAGATGREVTRMTRSVKEMAPAVGTTPEELAKGLYHIESAGLRGAKALSALRIAAEGAKVGHTDLEGVANALVATLKSEIGGVSSMGEAMGALNAIVGAGNMRMGDLAEALSSGILPAAKAFGLSLQDVGAALGTMTSAGVPATDAATRLRMTFSLLAAPTSQAQKALKLVGISGLELAHSMKTDGLIPTVELLAKRLRESGYTAEQQNAIIAKAFGGGRTSATIITLIQHVDDLRKRLGQINEGASGFGEAWRKTEQESSFRMDRLGARLHVLAIEAGDKLAPALADVADEATEMIDRASRSEEFHRTLRGIAADARNAARFVGDVAHALGGWGPALKEALAGYTALKIGVVGANVAMRVSTVAAATSMKAALASTGFGLLAIGAGAAAVYVITHWSRVKEWFREFRVFMRETALRIGLEFEEPFSHLPGRLGARARELKSRWQRELGESEFRNHGGRVGTAWVTAVKKQMGELPGWARAQVVGQLIRQSLLWQGTGTRQGRLYRAAAEKEMAGLPGWVRSQLLAKMNAAAQDAGRSAGDRFGREFTQTAADWLQQIVNDIRLLKNYAATVESSGAAAAESPNRAARTQGPALAPDLSTGPRRRPPPSSPPVDTGVPADPFATPPGAAKKKKSGASAAAAAARAKQQAIVRTAQTQLGEPYRFGGPAVLNQSTDCSGLAQAVMRQNGISIPRTSQAQYGSGTPVAWSDLQPGDLVFFYGPHPDHVGIYVGGGQMIHDPHTGDHVRYADITTSYWRSKYVGARRYVKGAKPGGGGATGAAADARRQESADERRADVGAIRRQLPRVAARIQQLVEKGILTPETGAVVRARAAELRKLIAAALKDGVITPQELSAIKAKFSSLQSTLKAGIDAAIRAAQTAKIVRKLIKAAFADGVLTDEEVNAVGEKVADLRTKYGRHVRALVKTIHDSREALDDAWGRVRDTILAAFDERVVGRVGLNRQRGDEALTRATAQKAAERAVGRIASIETGGVSPVMAAIRERGHALIAAYDGFIHAEEQASGPGGEAQIQQAADKLAEAQDQWDSLAGEWTDTETAYHDAWQRLIDAKATLAQDAITKFQARDEAEKKLVRKAIEKKLSKIYTDLRAGTITKDQAFAAINDLLAPYGLSLADMGDMLDTSDLQDALGDLTSAIDALTKAIADLQGPVPPVSRPRQPVGDDTTRGYAGYSAAVGAGRGDVMVRTPAGLGASPYATPTVPAQPVVVQNTFNFPPGILIGTEETVAARLEKLITDKQISRAELNGGNLFQGRVLR